MSDDDGICRVSVPCPVGHRLQFKWGIGSSFHVIGVRGATSEQQGLRGDVHAESHTISTVIWDSAPRSHEALAHSIAQTFSELQQAREQTSASATETLQLISDYSRKVREKLSCGNRFLGSEDDLRLSTEHAIWQLLEVFCIDSARSEGFIAEDIVRWLSDNRSLVGHLLSPASLEGRLEALLASPRPDASTDFWPCLRNVVAVGWMPEALQLLGAHDILRSEGTPALQQPDLARQYELLDALFVLMRSMPRFRLASGGDTTGGRAFDSMPEFLAYRQRWQSNCATLATTYPDLFNDCRSVNARTADGVQSVLDILGGDETALSSNTSSWPELLAGQLMHQVPQLRARHHMAPLLERCVAVKPYDERDMVPGLLHHLMLALSDMELQHVVELLAGQGVASTWLLCHVCEVLRAYPRAGAALERPLHMFGGDQIEYWRLSLAESLLAQPSRWQLAVQYLAWCQTHGAAAVELLLEALPVASSSDERQLVKAQRCASLHGLPAAAVGLSRRAGVAAWYDGRLGAALGHLAQGRDERRMAAVMGPLEAEVEALLVANIGSYGGAALKLPGAEELQEVLAPLCQTAGVSPSGSMPDSAARPTTLSQQQQGTAPAESIQPYHAHASWLFNFLELQDAAEAVALAQGAELAAAEARYRTALMALVYGGTVPARLCGLLLFSAVPFLEGHSGTLAFGTQDVQALQQWLISCEQATLAGSVPLTSAAALGPRHVRDIRLALARGEARAHVCHNTVRA